MSIGFSAQAMEVIAECGALKGFVKYVPSPLTKDSHDWEEDAISKASVIIIKSGDEFGLLVKDALGELKKDSTQTVLPLRLQPNNLLFAVAYDDNNVTEIYNFYSAEGHHYYTMYQSRGGEFIAKNSLMAGLCTDINYSVFFE